ATPFISVVLLGTFWRRTSYAGAVAGLVGGLLVQIALGVGLWGIGSTLHWLYVGAIAQVLTMLVIVVVSLNSMPPAPEQTEPFLWRPGWLRSEDEGKGPPPRRPRIKVWFPLYAVLLIWVYIWFW